MNDHRLGWAGAARLIAEEYEAPRAVRVTPARPRMTKAQEDARRQEDVDPSLLPELMHITLPTPYWPTINSALLYAGNPIASVECGSWLDGGTLTMSFGANQGPSVAEILSAYQGTAQAAKQHAIVYEHWTWGGTGLTNFAAEQRPVYEEAIRRHGDKSLVLSDVSIHGSCGAHSLHKLGGMVDLGDFWSIFDQVKAEHDKTAQDGWIAWRGGECPVPEGTEVDVRFRKGHTEYGLTALQTGTRASVPYWRNDGIDFDIVAYRIAK